MEPGKLGSLSGLKGIKLVLIPTHCGLVEFPLGVARCGSQD